jgi:predicted nucleic acid-binding protein
MRQVILDTDILSYIIDRRYHEVVATAKQYARAFRYFSVSVVTICEIVEGLESQGNHEGTAAFLKLAKDFEVMPVETEEAVLAGRILGALTRSGQKIGDLDPFIAAVAIQNQRPLVTNNSQHYQRIVDLGFPLVLENWRKP